MANYTLAIFGITGQTGRALAKVSTARGWSVRGLVRPGSEVTGLEGATIVRGNLSDPVCLAEVVDSTDAVYCVFGPRPPYTEAFCADATAGIIAAMRGNGVQRIICQTGAMIGAGNRTRPFEWLSAVVGKQQHAVIRDRIEQERLIMDSGLAWTLVKPPRLTNATDIHRVQDGVQLRIGLLSSIGRTSLAHFLLDVLEREDTVGARLFVRE